jgi:hypothetical protein
MRSKRSIGPSWPQAILVTCACVTTSLLAFRSNPIEPGQGRQILRRKVLPSNPCQIAKMTTLSEAHLL